MLYPVLQCAAAVFKLLFGLTALRISPGERTPDPKLMAWQVVGVVFVISGGLGLIHSGAALLAFVGGAGSPIYDAFLRWSPAGNHSRHVALVAGIMCLLFMPKRHPLRWPRLHVLLAAMLMGGMLGAYAGWAEGSLLEARHYPVVAMLDAVEATLLFGILLHGVWQNSMDRILFAALSIYATRQAINVISYSAVAWIGVEGAWAPTTAHIIWVGAVMWLVLWGLALYRRLLARRGVGVRALLEPNEPAKYSVLG